MFWAKFRSYYILCTLKLCENDGSFREKRKGGGVSWARGRVETAQGTYNTCNSQITLTRYYCWPYTHTHRVRSGYQSHLLMYRLTRFILVCGALVVGCTGTTIIPTDSPSIIATLSCLSTLLCLQLIRKMFNMSSRHHRDPHSMYQQYVNWIFFVSAYFLFEFFIYLCVQLLFQSGCVTPLSRLVGFIKRCSFFLSLTINKYVKKLSKRLILFNVNKSIITLRNTNLNPSMNVSEQLLE